jgi:hypothetical protein
MKTGNSLVGPPAVESETASFERVSFERGTRCLSFRIFRGARRIPPVPRDPRVRDPRVPRDPRDARLG